MNERSIVDTMDLSYREVCDVIDLSKVLKRAAAAGAVPRILDGMSLALVFDSHSTRSRLSFDAAMGSLGGHCAYLPTQTLHLGSGMETIGDTARVLSGMVDGVVIRATRQAVVDELARRSSVPVLSAMGADGLHPAQALADLLTIMEHRPEGASLNEITVVVMGDTSNESDAADCVFASLFRLLPRFGIKVVACSPKGFEPTTEFVQWINEEVALNGGSLTVCYDPIDCLSDADFVYAGAWVYYDDGHTQEEAERLFLPGYQINDTLLSCTPDHCKVMHYMPGNRGLEITDSVWDSPRSLLFDEAANRLATARGMLAWALYPRQKHPGAEERQRYEDETLALLAR